MSRAMPVFSQHSTRGRGSLSLPLWAGIFLAFTLAAAGNVAAGGANDGGARVSGMSAVRSGARSSTSSQGLRVTLAVDYCVAGVAQRADGVRVMVGPSALVRKFVATSFATGWTHYQ